MTRAGTVSGFTLIEQLVGLAILGISLLGTTALFTQALQSLRDGSHHHTALVAMENLLEHVVAVDAAGSLTSGSCVFGSAPCPAVSSYDVAGWFDELRRGVPGAGVHMEVTDEAGTRRISVVVAWRNSRADLVQTRLERTVRL